MAFNFIKRKDINMIVLTSGNKYLDIDGYASCLAYRELLKLQGIDAKFVSTAAPNSSVPKSLLDLSLRLDEYDITLNDKFIIIDLSNKDFFENFVQEENVIELIDHHPGFEKFWQDKLGEKSIIEPVGAVATIIFEKYEQANLLNKMSKEIAKLLMAAILDNTLNFTAKITTERDHIAYQKLEAISEEYNFKSYYFNECQEFIENNLINSIVNDLKIEITNDTLSKVLGQLIIWDITSVLKRLDEIKASLNQYNNWIINIVSLKENKSYIVCSSKEVLRKLNMLFNLETNDEIIIIEPALLRKELIKKSFQYCNK